MTVVYRFSADEATRRTIRAAHGRGGLATRKEMLTFLDRALHAALKAAPAPKVKRRRVVPRGPTFAIPADDPVASRERIRKLYNRAS